VSFDEWLTVLRTERSPNRVAQALSAIENLIDDANAPQAAAAIVEIFCVFGPDFRYRTAGSEPALRGRGSAGMLTIPANRALDRISPAAKSAVFVDHFQQRGSNSNAQSKRFVVQYLAGALRKGSELQTLFSPEIIDALLRESRSEPSQLRLETFRLLSSLVAAGAADEKVRSRVHEGLAEGDADYLYAALGGMAGNESHVDFVLQEVTKRLAGGTPAEKVASAAVAAQLKQRSASVVPALLDILATDHPDSYAAVHAPADAIAFLSSCSDRQYRFTTACPRDAAVVALGEIHDNSPAVLAALKTELGKRNEWPEPIRLPSSALRGFGDRGDRGLFDGVKPAGKYPGPEVPESYSGGLVREVLQRLERPSGQADGVSRPVPAN
jgi:hypothetical protein